MDIVNIDNKSCIGRLAFRTEGQNWVAYYMLPDSVEDAVFIASIPKGAAARSPQIRQDFMNLARQIVNAVLTDALGFVPEWGGEEPAPEHEKSGSA